MKPRTKPLLRLTAALAIASATAHAADLTWNAAFPGTWDTSNTNWTNTVPASVAWNNGTPDNAIFNNATGTITLGEAITGGSLGFYNGGAVSGNHELLLTGSNLSVASVLSWGGYYGPLGGAVDSIAQAYGQRLRFDSMNLNVSGNATVRRGMLYFIGATVNVGGTINSADAWSVFRSDNSTVTATGGIDLSVIASQVELYGGTVTTPFIKVGNAAFINGTGGLTMGSGVTVVASQNNTDFIQVYNNGDTNSRGAAGLSTGGMTLDTSTYAVTVDTVLNGEGSLTKTGSGTLTLSKSNNYTGGTTISGGTLALSGSGTLGATSGALTINNATLDLGSTTQTVASVASGSTSSNNSGAIIGTGTLNVSGNFAYQGNSANGDNYASNPTFTVASNVAVTGDTLIGRANFTITGGTYTTNRFTANPSSADWANLTISGGTVTATNGIDGTYGTNGSNGTNATFNLTLNGGTLYTPSIKVADRQSGGLARLTFNGGTVVATADTSAFITTYGGGNNVYISNGGAIIDTNGYNIEIGTLLRNSDGNNGSLTKNGDGTLTLSYNTGATIGTYSGATTVNDGTLALKSGTAWVLLGGSAVTVNSGATLQGNDSLANQLNGLTLNNGTVTASGSGNADWGNFYLTGNVTATGTSSMNADIALRASNVDFSVASGGTLNVGGTLHNGAFYGIYSGSPATVSKSGDGTMVFSTTHTYTGATTVSAGKLKVTGSIASSDVTVNGGVLASGSTGGTVGKNVTVNSGATFAAGDVGTVGTATVASNLNFNSLSIFEWDLAGNTTTGAGTNFDSVTVTGTLTIASDAVFRVIQNSGLDFDNIFWDSTQTWSNIFTAGTLNSSWNNATVAVYDTSNVLQNVTSFGSFSITGGDLTWTPVPEPTSALAGLLLTAGLLRRRREH